MSTNASRGSQRPPLKKKQTGPKKYGWIQTVVNIWALKLSITLVGFSISGIILIWRSFFPLEIKAQNIYAATSVSWNEFMPDNFRIVNSIRINAAPYIVTDVPLANSSSIIDVLNEMPAFLSSNVRLSNRSNVFKYYSRDRLWSEIPSLQNFSISEEIISMKSFLDHRFQHILQSHGTINEYCAKYVKDEHDNLTTCEAVPNSTAHFYITCPNMMAAVEKIAPSLVSLFATQVGDPRVSIWVAR